MSEVEKSIDGKVCPVIVANCYHSRCFNDLDRFQYKGLFVVGILLNV